MPAIRGNAGAKWVRRTQNAGEEYAAGVREPRASWQQSTIAAATNQAKGVQQAITEKRFEKGVAKAGDARWAQKALSKGVARFGPGVAEAQGDYETGFAPYAQVIQSTQLPPRGPKGDPSNIERVRVMAKALNDAKRKR
jgi:hypothetical protein